MTGISAWRTGSSTSSPGAIKGPWSSWGMPIGPVSRPPCGPGGWPWSRSPLRNSNGLQHRELALLVRLDRREEGVRVAGDRVGGVRLDLPQVGGPGEGRIDRELGDDGDVVLPGDGGRVGLPEEADLGGTVRAGDPRHVFDDPEEG